MVCLILRKSNVLNQCKVGFVQKQQHLRAIVMRRTDSPLQFISMQMIAHSECLLEHNLVGDSLRVELNFKMFVHLGELGVASVLPCSVHHFRQTLKCQSVYLIHVAIKNHGILWACWLVGSWGSTLKLQLRILLNVDGKTGCFRKSFTTLKAYINLFRGHVQCFERS
jgi:hypothetical protein